MLALRPRVQVMAYDGNSGVLVLNTSPGDLSLRFHEPVALRRLARVQLDLPPLRDFDPCLFQQYPDAFPALPTESSAGAIQNFQYLSASEVVVATVAAPPASGKAAAGKASFSSSSSSDADANAASPTTAWCQAALFCAVSGTKLALLVGHQTPLTCLTWAAAPEYALTGCRDGTVRVWDLGSAVLPDVAAQWAPQRRRSGGGSHPGDAEAAHTLRMETALIAGESRGGRLALGGGPTPDARRVARAKAAIVRGLELTGMRKEWRLGVVTGVFDAGDLTVGGKGDALLGKSAAAAAAAAARRRCRGAPSRSSSWAAKAGRRRRGRRRVPRHASSR